MNTDKLEYFRCVCEVGSIAAAAERLFIARPSLSAAIGGLEHELGVRLLHRSKEGVRPTESGQLLLEFIARSQEDWSQLLRNMEALQGGAPHAVRFGFTGGTLGQDVVGRIYEYEGASGVSVEISNRDQPDFWKAVAEERLDLAITVRPPAETRLEAVRINRCRQVLVMAAHSPLCQRDFIDFAHDLAGITLLETEERFTPHLKQLEALGIQRKMVGEDRGFIKELVARDRGCVMTIEALVERYLSDQTRAVPVHNIPSDIDLDPYLVFRHDVSRRVLDFANYVLECLGSQARL